MPGRTDNQVKNRFNSTLRRLIASQKKDGSAGSTSATSARDASSSPRKAPSRPQSRLGDNRSDGVNAPSTPSRSKRERSLSPGETVEQAGSPKRSRDRSSKLAEKRGNVGDSRIDVPRKSDKKKDSKKKKSSHIRNEDKPSAKKYCKLHGKNHTHDTAECKVLSNRSENGSKNKTWKRDANKSKDNTKKELAAFIPQTIKKELNSFGKMAGTRQASEQTRILYEYYDLTDARINRLFNSFDANKNGKLSSDEFIVGLALQGILPHGDGEGLTELAHDVKRSKSREGGNASVRDLSGKFASSVLRRQSSSEVVATSADDSEQAADSMHVEAVFKESTNYKLMEDLFAAVDEDQDQYVNKNEFRMCVQRLKLSMLLDTAMEIDTRLALTNSEENANPTNMALIDYGPTAVAFGNYPMDKDDLESFLFGVRPQQYKMTWISVSPSRENSTCGVDPLVILRLAVKYRLHPLAIHDAMTLGEQGPQVDEYGGKFIFIILPAIRITKETETDWRECSA